MVRARSIEPGGIRLHEPRAPAPKGRLEARALTVPSQDHRPPVDVRDAAYVGCSERFLRRLVFERRIPFLKVGGSKVRFMPTDLDAWLLAQRVDAVR